ncbi:hypothetical protein H113_00565 [Trichophyton rubrum MR1459]|uniref:Uncharacterized protein n=1 Tax=Trichophyton soudanense CBS 452.61 TaxID=1215331 RepID=A0A022Y6Y7_TRISD|nr:hypothetical protein H104_00550 [Trichophyton rubrum CBS 289.86]EZF78393.1 hypothetical protein H105_00548 [Trichophyton soudanense CBS 452.61]EZF89089.1 hypothetical protein H110_00564 [Trichophyton rubrum MR1448]EZF99846.1 hypothetical protein H113_00565 [Trichophyton rubrum MR1459]KMQ46391.1 hypothetical protein HL42_2905 [Trichophyton rubrum]
MLLQRTVLTDCHGTRTSSCHSFTINALRSPGLFSRWTEHVQPSKCLLAVVDVVLLVVKQEEEEDKRARVKAASAYQPWEALLSSRKLLMVDDSEASAGEGKRMLSGLAHDYELVWDLVHTPASLSGKDDAITKQAIEWLPDGNDANSASGVQLGCCVRRTLCCVEGRYSRIDTVDLQSHGQSRSISFL